MAGPRERPERVQQVGGVRLDGQLLTIISEVSIQGVSLNIRINIVLCTSGGRMYKGDKYKTLGENHE